MIGQDEIKNYLNKQILNNKIANAYLINGEKGIGKKTLAKEFAQTILCDNKNACGECPSCRKVLSSNHPDLIIVSADDGKTFKVEQVRGIKDLVAKSPYESDRLVVIIENAERMNDSGQNALLKNIEEANNVTYIITADKPLLPTIVSRCVLIKPRPITDEEIKPFVNPDLTSNEMQCAINFAQGNVGKIKAFDRKFFDNKTDLLNTVTTNPLNWQFKLAEKLKECPVSDITEALFIIRSLYLDALKKDIKIQKNDYKDYVMSICKENAFEKIELIQKAIYCIENTNVNKKMMLTNLFLSL